MKKMRRSKQALSNEKCIEILNKNTYFKKNFSINL